MNTVFLFVTVGIKFSLNPQLVTNPVFCVFKTLNNLSFAVLKNGKVFDVDFSALPS